MVLGFSDVGFWGCWVFACKFLECWIFRMLGFLDVGFLVVGFSECWVLVLMWFWFCFCHRITLSDSYFNFK